MKRCSKLAIAMLSLMLLLPARSALALTVSESITDIDLAAGQEAPGIRISRLTESSDFSALPHESLIYTVTQNGIYRFSGELSGGQIRVDAPGADQVQIILSGVTLSNAAAPVLAVENAAEAEDASAPVRISLEAGTNNTLNRADEASQEQKPGQTPQGEGAIMSSTGLAFDGEGGLSISAGGRGISAQGSIAFDGGRVSVLAGSDAISAQGDILISGGSLSAGALESGSALRATGGIFLSGGTLIASAAPAGTQSALHSVLGLSISGGTLAAAGNSYGKIDERSAQRFIHLAFSKPFEQDVPLVLTEKEGRALMAFAPSDSYTQLTLSSPSLSEGQYVLYTGGHLDGEARDGLYPAGIAYLPGKPLQTGGSTRDAKIISGYTQPDAFLSSSQAKQNEETAWFPFSPSKTSSAPGSSPETAPTLFPPEQAADTNAPALPSPQPTAPGGIISSTFPLSSQSYFFLDVREKE